MSLKKFAVVAASVLMSSTAMAAQRYVLNLNDAEFSGRSVIPLKQLLKRQHGIRVERFDLEQVSMMAKSKHGRATGALKVGNFRSGEQRIHGDPRSYRNDSPFTFDRLSFFNNARRDRGEWQIVLEGNVKVRRIVVVLDRERRDERDRDDRRGRDGRDRDRRGPSDDLELELN